ncbi:hypothetical protein [Haloarcula nitratireducens]|uniref:Uncharacterized protein n=1 Tax=Haloarcula nitratireducens TaxID=2487749 RepID=A0AAW4PAM9_9EURY|nr:hypothetical protein [Halomicroarcula nitratireducens]MBX0294802.1 hypothetical protein [Halomicroarcula nitratireducens]
MSQRRSTHATVGTIDPVAVGSAATRVGLALLVGALPVVAGTFAGMVADAATLGVALDAAAAALDGPLVGGFTTGRLFHVGVLGALVGCWLLGAGLVLDGYFGGRDE